MNSTLSSQAPEKIRTASELIGQPPALWTQNLLQRPLPFPAEFWLVLENDRVLGRIAANLSPVYQDLGYVGFLRPLMKRRPIFFLKNLVQWLKTREKNSSRSSEFKYLATLSLPHDLARSAGFFVGAAPTVKLPFVFF